MSTIKENPLASTVIGLGALAAAALAIMSFSDEIDGLVVTEAELTVILGQHANQPHPSALAQINAALAEVEDARQQSTCESIGIRIAIIEDQIWQMEQSGRETQRLVDKRRELRNLQNKATALNCARFL